MPIAPKKGKIIGVKWVSREQAAATVDARARRVLGVPGEKFIANWKAGMYRELDSDACPGVIELALLAPLPKSRGRKNTKRSSR